MKKGIALGLLLLLVLGLMSVAQSPASAAPAKVVKIQPAKIESAPAPRQKVEPVAPTTIEELPPQPAPVVEQPAPPPPAYKMSGPYVGISGGYGQPGFAVGLGAGLTLFTIMDKTDINARVGIGYASKDAANGYVAGADLVLAFRQLATPTFPLVLGVGGGVAYPVKMNGDRKGELGYEAFGGAYLNITENIQLGGEAGYLDLKYKEGAAAKSAKGFLGRVGLNWFF